MQMCARSQRPFGELHEVEGGGGERKFSKTFFFPLNGSWRSSVGFSQEADPTRRAKKTRGSRTVSPSSRFVFLTWEPRGKDARVCRSCVLCSFPDWEDLHHQRRWDVSELCLVEMDRLYPSENMASASRGSASSPRCWWLSAAWRHGAPGRRGTAAGAVAPVPLTAAARWRDSSRPASSTAPASGWRGPQHRRTSRCPPACCKCSLQYKWEDMNSM